MKRVLAIVFLAAVIFFAWWLFFKGSGKGSGASEKEGPVVVNKHSNVFNDSVAAAISSYMLLKDAFVNADTALARQLAAEFVSAIEKIPLEELKNDDPKIMSAAQQQVSNIKANANPIVSGENLTEMRHDFYMVSENMYPFLNTIGYEGQKLYWQNCPMAFGEGQEANWLSYTRQINNPYLGKNHPEFKSSMLHCGEVKDSIFAK